MYIVIQYLLHQLLSLFIADANRIKPSHAWKYINHDLTIQCDTQTPAVWLFNGHKTLPKNAMILGNRHLALLNLMEWNIGMYEYCGFTESGLPFASQMVLKVTGSYFQSHSLPLIIGHF